MPKAYSYRRFSTPEQMKGDSLRRQVHLAETYAARHGLDLDDELSFQDLGQSAYRGGNVETGHLGKFLYAAKNGLVEPGSYLLVESLDRISRDKARRAMRVLEDICDAGITVVTLIDEQKYTSESLDDPFGLMMSLMSFARANEESALKSRRLKAAWENKRANASDKPLTSRAPAWLQLDREKGAFDVLEDRAQIVRDIYKWTLEGTGQHSIAERLNRGCVAVFGRGKQWHRSYIAKLLKSEAVIGTYIPHTQEYKDGRKVRIAQEPVEGYYPVVVSEESFHRVQSLSRYSQAPRRGRHAKAPVRNLFGGLAKCPKCDSTMTLVNKGKNGGKPFLICTKAKAGAGCIYRSVKYGPVEKAFLTGWQRVAVDFPAGDPALDAKVHAKAASAEATQEAIVNLLEALEAGGDSPALMKRLRHLEDSLEELEGELGELGRQQVAVAGRITESKALDLEKALVEEPLDRAKVNSLLRQVFEKVVVNYDSGELEFCWQQGGSVGSVMFAWPIEAE